jgi:hypothetical protein
MEGCLMLVLAFVAGFALALFASVVVRGSEPNRWDYLSAAPSTGVHAHLALGSATIGQDVYVSIGGSDFLDIVQVGAKRDSGGRHLYAAWGSGVPGSGVYIERSLGPVGTGFHAYTLRLSSGVWRFWVDGTLRLTVRDTFRRWHLQSSKAAVESETGGALGGTRSNPVRIVGARTWFRSWRVPVWYSGGYRVPSTTADAFGSDWLSVWRTR